MNPLQPELGDALLRLARAAIAQKLGDLQNPAVDLPELRKKAATFVTLTQHGQLRGCIGSLVAHRPLRDDVIANALAAAFHDPRFPPLTAEEFPHTRVEVSLLSAADAFPVADEADALARLRPGIDGLIFSAAGRRSTFLPQVWEQLPDPADFLTHLKQKAGLPADYWGPDVRLERYTVHKWMEARA
jgi:AmmeMemoRadiSam system protein A